MNRSSLPAHYSVNTFQFFVQKSYLNSRLDVCEIKDVDMFGIVPTMICILVRIL